MRQRKLKNLDAKYEAYADLLIDDPAAMRGRWGERSGGAPLFIEIGCGKGKFISELAAREPQHFFIAVEGNRSVMLRAMEKIRRLGEGVFKGCNVKKAVFEDGITSLSAYTFYECKALEKVLLPRTLKNIGERCFMFCKALRYIEFPESLCNMGYQAF